MPRLRFVTALLLFSITAFANRVVVYGTVKFPNGVVAVNFPLKIQADTVAGNCLVNKSVLTNQNGSFEAVLECSYPIEKTIINYRDCEGQLVQVVKEVSSSYLVEYNIVLCVLRGCKAYFVWQANSTNNLSIQFNSSGSHASSSIPDEIVSRQWSWGDGSSIADGNMIAPVHVFQKAGTYEVCLKIVTRNGCQSTVCYPVVAGDNQPCKAAFRYEPITNDDTLKTYIKFFSGNSIGTSNDDHVIGRSWNFGDGTSLVSNDSNIVHAYAHGGTYTVCLYIKTGKGCYDSVCSEVIVPGPQPPRCEPAFTWVTDGLKLNFNSHASGVAAGDSIIRRYWTFGDGTAMDGNVIEAYHTYLNSGQYEVCLRTVTKNGCEQKICKIISIESFHCEAAFMYEPITNDDTSKTYIKFFSSNSTGTSNDDQVIGRSWNFGDGTSLVSNDSSIVHAYAHGGTYTVCLYIKTGKGCYDSVCREVVVPGPQPTRCEPAFTWVTDGLKLNFNSHSSGVAAGDSIIHRYWTFGDGIAMDGNMVAPYHVYQHSGQYEVCLRIVTKKGCEQTVCKIINIASLHCKAAFSYKAITNDDTSKTYIKFFSGNSIGTSNDDHVIGRSWNFGDGTSLVSNDSNIVHAYAHGGNYTVCLYIKTGKGCYDSICREVVVPGPQAPRCEPAFTWVTDGLNLNFNSHSSGVATGDSIIRRYWIFGDGVAMDGNIIEPYHVYQHSGQYEVCLRIVTKKGCEQTICKIINIESLHCKAAFGYEAITNDDTLKTYIKFFSGNSTGTSNDDHVIGRSWNFGDGTSLVSNDSSIVHAFAHGGTYTVCLYIKTGKGCYDSVCREVVVPGPQPTRCEPAFTWVTDGLKLNFNSHSSGVATGDSIILRYWIFGDGVAMDGNIIEPYHVYQHSGQYEVCLRIVTKKGCEQTICKIINIESLHCKAAFGYEAITNDDTLKTYIKFFSGNSTGTSNDDHVIGRSWNFGDGTSLVSNDSSIVHAFAHGGTYTVCLYIKTGKGCYDSVCREVVVPGPQPTRCEPAFTWVTDGLKLNFNSHSSGVAAGDSIIHRYWTFGDGTAMDGNMVAPYHVYQHSGQYEVCLRIVTKKGCEQKICKIISIESFHCEAAFRYEPITNDDTSKTYIKFFSSNSTGTSNDDQVIGRSWNFGDGTSLVSNDSSIVHAYAHRGTYTVCLFIKTGKGCYDSVCREVVVPGPQSPRCEPAFTWVTDGLNLNFNSHSSGVATGDSIIRRYWIFGDGVAMDGNIIEPYHVYQHSGQYEVCLRIVTKKGCEQTICKIINIESLHCKAAFGYEAITNDDTLKTYIKFFSGNSTGTSNDDHVIGRSWNFGDGTSLVSNDSNIVHVYAHGGNYTVCLYIKTGKGCYDSVCREVVVPGLQSPRCEPAFTWVTDGLKLNFNSHSSGVAAGDSIIHRYWTFGDGTAMDGNTIEPYHVYQHSGQYEVCLRIVTRKGCEQSICQVIASDHSSLKCHAQFRFENIGNRKLRFNSSGSYHIMQDDSIINRSWYFGDGSSLYGNIIPPVHEYKNAGTYTACLVVVTKSGCESRICYEVKVDGDNISDSADIRLLNTYPNPSTNNLFVAIWSKHTNVPSELEVYDVYGIKKWSKQIILPQGNSVWPVPTGFLLASPYVLRVTTVYGTQHKNFIRIN